MVGDGGFSPEFRHFVDKNTVKLSSFALLLIALTGCKSADQRSISPTEAAAMPLPYGKAEVNGNAPKAYLEACKDYFGKVLQKPAQTVSDKCDTLIHEYDEGTSDIIAHTVWVTPEGVEIFDAGPALFHRVTDGTSMSFSEGLQDQFGNGSWVVYSESFPEMNELLTGMYDANVPAKLTRWDNSTITPYVGAGAYKSALGITE